ncbi:MAG: hypothetical protein ACOYOT_01995 [Bacteroidales bacterium]
MAEYDPSENPETLPTVVGRHSGSPETLIFVVGTPSEVPETFPTVVGLFSGNPDYTPHRM